MMKHVILIYLVAATATSLFGQQINLSGERIGEEELSLEDLYIGAQQKKILEKYDEALEIYEKILVKNEVNASVYHDMARIYLKLNENEKAISAGKKAVRYDKGNFWFKLTLAEIYEINHNYSEAANTIAQVLVNKKDAALYERMAHDLNLANKKTEAINIYNQADQLFGMSEYRSDSKVDLFLELGKEKEAINEVKKWVDKDPKNVEAWIKLARFYEFRGDIKKSEKTYREALSRDPNNEEAIFKTSKSNSTSAESDSELGKIINDPRIGIDNKVKTLLPHLRTKEISTSLLTHCQSLIGQYPENPKTYALYGDFLWLNNDATNAIIQYQKSLSISKSVYEVWDQLMMILAFERKYDELADVSKEALDYYPNQAGPYYYNALALSSKESYKEAKSMNDEALFIAEIGGGYMAEQSRILNAQLLSYDGKTKEAISFIESLTDTDITAGLEELLGDLYFKEGDKSRAEQAWKRALTKGGDKNRIGLKIQSI